MLVVFDKKTSKGNFNNNGLAVLDECIIAEITEELNGDYSLYIEYPTDTPKAKHLVEFNLIKANNQLFRIYKVERQQENIRRVKVWARHIFYDLAFYFVEAVNLINANMKEAVEGTIPPEAQSIFELKAPARNIFPVKMRNINALEGLFNLIEIYGGELIRNNFKVEVLEKRGDENGVTIRYGKNIKWLKAIIDTSEFATRIYPIGDNNLVLQERYIEAEGRVANILPYPITRKVEFTGCNDVEKLRSLAQEHIKKASNPFINITVDFLELSKIKEYEEYADLFRMELGDVVKVEHEKLGIYSELRVIKKVIDLLNPINTKIELGNPLSTIINRLDFTNVVARLERKIEGSESAVILKKNSEPITISSTSFYQTIVVGISALADTNLSCNVTINGSASTDLVLHMRFSLDGEHYDFQPKQHLAEGDNVISINLPLPQVTAGKHAFVVEAKTSEGTFHIDKNNLQISIEGRYLEGGLSPSLPRAEVMQGISYLLYLSKIDDYIDALKTEETILKIEDEEIENIQEITYSETLNKAPTAIDSVTEITMVVSGIHQTANENFYLNLNTDDWVKDFSELVNVGDDNFEMKQYITIKEVKPVIYGEKGAALGAGAAFTVEFSDQNQYEDLIDFQVELIEK
ncbi:phage minor structural protein [Desulfitispora alkaliphila]|uniref:phage tail spike protein n=1 Tax=Desulfitispora alkaliphila TaxID=622674 RepID=UPI003D1DD675